MTMRGAQLESTLTLLEFMLRRLTTISRDAGAPADDESAPDSDRLWATGLDVADLIPIAEVVLERERDREMTPRSADFKGPGGASEISMKEAAPKEVFRPMTERDDD
jgi:hypothetical protein